MKNLHLASYVVLMILKLTAGQCFSENDDSIKSVSNVSAFSDGTIDFAIALFKEVCRPHATRSTENIFISPISVHSAMTIAYLGALGNTKVQLENGLHLGDSNQKRVLALYRQLKENYLLHNATKNANYTLNVANKLYVDETVQLRKCMQEYLDDEVEKLDFIGLPDLARTVINEWVEEQTNRKITDLIPSGFLDSSSRIVIVNAAYFRGYWSSQFKEDATHRRDFHIEPDDVVKVDMMWEEDTFLFINYTAMNCSAIELPYSGNKMSMVVLLPNLGTKIEALIAAISRERLMKMYSQMKSTLVDLSIPKFKLKQAFELTHNLYALGMTDLFDPTRANLSGFHTDKQNMSIPFIRHKTFIEVNEGGTEAAAATAFGKRHIDLDKRMPVRLIVDRPFVFIIRNKDLDSVLFAGLIRNPSSAL